MYKKGLLCEIDLERERDEFFRHGDTDKEMAAAKKGRTATIKSLKGKGLSGSSEAPGIKKGQLLKVMRQARDHGKSKKDRRRAYNLVKSGKDEPSIIRTSGKGKNKKRALVAGNTRAMLRAALGKAQKVHVYKALDEKRRHPRNEAERVLRQQDRYQRGTARAEQLRGLEAAGGTNAPKGHTRKAGNALQRLNQKQGSKAGKENTRVRHVKNHIMMGIRDEDGQLTPKASKTYVAHRKANLQRTREKRQFNQSMGES